MDKFWTKAYCLKIQLVANLENVYQYQTRNYEKDGKTIVAMLSADCN